MERIFENTEIALELKSDEEISRSYFLFSLIKKEPLVKIGTAITKFALKTNMPVEKLIRTTVFDHFCGGINESDCLPIIKKMYAKKVYSVLDYSAEGKEEEVQFDYAVQKTLSTLEYAKDNEAIPFVVFKPTGFGRFEIYKKLSAGTSLSDREKIEWGEIRKRYIEVCDKAHSYNIPVLIDAEESWMQDAADTLVEEMMKRYNKDRVIVFNTLQAYRWDRLDYLKELLEKARHQKFKIGIKLVRGAYMEKERERALKYGYKDPICINKSATDKLFNDCLKYMMNNLGDIEFFLGTHNENSSYLLMELLKENGLDNNDKRVWYGQLYGMSDHISYNLSNTGYNVAKYLPFGPVKDVMPYLIRRAEENTSVVGQTSRELQIIKKEKERRKNLKNNTANFKNN
ncbi:MULTISPECIES: proline dehydrogenase family protein [Flagellimonas]|uniref:Proline dehydrogenase family protein n=2 Tax=Flagellimonas TaxID=444459 RepID=A0ABT5XRN8_9FLAO|nr:MULTISPECIES: proline dehydrogenase family protein [Allomuricauda]MBO0356190.1 proline dehydrogenase family protein [Allomuricauda aurea]MDF0708561.1 proline dehydrogenase family protein [[Muricauda] okinawensis]